MADGPNLLGEYLRARRELVTPEMAGIPVLGARRVPGLRREEVAMLAGISADYYLRLEQGRDRNPSVQVLESIVRVLQLDDVALGYLVSLSADRPDRNRRRPRRRETLPTGIGKLVAGLEQPAFVEGRYFDVLAANRLATALSPRLVVGGNRLRDVFLDEAEQALFPDVDRAMAHLLAGFRASVGSDPDDPRVVELVGELSIASSAFRRLWARQDVATRAGAVVTMQHPQVGTMTLNREKLAIGDVEGMMLVIYHADAGSTDAEKLALLGSASAPVAPSSPGGRAVRSEHDRR
jgi:transcriptional regulator with XRE-family HTH domain